MNEPVCHLDAVTCRYGKVRAVDGVTATLHPGVTGLLGPNGAGKTTLLSVLATLRAADAGRLRLLGLDPTDDDDRVRIRRHLGYLPQELGFHRWFTTFDFVDYVAVLKEHTDRVARHAEVERVLGLVGLSDRGDDRIRTLSGGMRRRVALAQALLGDPHLLLLDEPTAGLDPEQRMVFRDLISRLGEDHTVVVSTHQTEDVAAMCQQVLVLQHGTVRFQGTPAELTATAAGHVWTADSRDPSARIVWRTAEGTMRHVGNPPEGAALVPPALEDAYLLLTGGSGDTSAAA